MTEYIDASIVVKWFKEGEEYQDEALKLRDRIINFETTFVMSHYGVLELVRALVKVRFPRDTIEDAFQSLNDLYDIGVLKGVRVEEILYLAKDIEIEVNLYVSDAVHLASAIHSDCDILWSVDDHHLKDKTKDFLRKYGIEVKHLSEVIL